MAQPDRIEIKDLLLRGIVGVNANERRKRQDILVNLVMTTDTRAVAAADSLDGALNYRTVSKQIIALVEDARFHTVERLAAEIARLVVTGHPVVQVQVTVEKPGALRFARSVGVTVVRGPEDFA